MFYLMLVFDRNKVDADDDDDDDDACVPKKPLGF